MRDPAKFKLSGVPAECLVMADLASSECSRQLLAAGEDVTVAVHLAGSLKAYRRRGFDDVNVFGTQRLVAALAQVAPSAHVVHVSSLAAAGPSVDGATSAASAEHCRTVSRYGESKRLGELAVIDSGLPFTILRPPVVYGPNDGATRLLMRQALAPLTAVPWRERPLSVIHADDVCEALWRAVQQRPTGVFLPLDGPERTNTHALMRTIAAACGRRARLLPMPMALASLAAFACDGVAWLRKQPGYFNRDKVREIGAVGWVADGRPVQRCLGFEPQQTLLAGMAAIARSEGFVRAAD